MMQKTITTSENENPFIKSKKQRRSLTLDNDIILEIEALAEADERSFSQYVNMILKRYLAELQKKSRP